MALSVMKPLHARWFLGAFDKVANQQAVVIAGWEKTGIASAVDSALVPATSVWID